MAISIRSFNMVLLKLKFTYFLNVLPPIHHANQMVVTNVPTILVEGNIFSNRTELIKIPPFFGHLELSKNPSLCLFKQTCLFFVKAPSLLYDLTIYRVFCLHCFVCVCVCMCVPICVKPLRCQ